MLGKKFFTLDVESSDTIDLVKAKIERQEGIPPVRQELYSFNCLELDPLRTLSYHGIQNESELKLIVNMNIFVAMPSGKTITIDVEPKEVVFYVKAKIEDQEGLPGDYFELMFECNVLDEGSTLLDCNIQHESTLTCLAVDANE